MLITKSVSIATEAVKAGVDRIFIDLEQLGKKERQGHLDTHISNHFIEDVKIMRAALPHCELLVRINPLHSGSGKEISNVIAAGADVVMLPMFTKQEEVTQFVGLVNNRARINLLVETPQALIRIGDILDNSPEVDEVHLGLNDLHLAMGLTFMFELLAGGIVELAAKEVKKRGKVFGFGGIARIGYGKVASELILSEHLRLGSKMVILSREFHKSAQDVVELAAHIDIREEILKIRHIERSLSRLTKVQLAMNTDRLKRRVAAVLEEKASNR